MKNKEQSYKRAYREIINAIVNYSTTHVYIDETGKKQRHPGMYGFFSEGYRDEADLRAKPGDLVKLGSVRGATEWYLSWYIKEIRHWYKNSDGSIDTERGYESEHIVKSIETGELCRWSNVGIYYCDRDEIRENWRWNDRQFEFSDRWFRLCDNEKEAYLLRPFYPEFGENGEVTLTMRRRHEALVSEEAYLPSKTFPDYRKVTKKHMSDFYDQCEANNSRKHI